MYDWLLFQKSGLLDHSNKKQKKLSISKSDIILKKIETKVTGREADALKAFIESWILYRERCGLSINIKFI